jgi:TonB family protein
MLAVCLWSGAGWAQESGKTAVSGTEAASRPPTIPLKEAKKHLISPVHAEYPAIANAAHIQGKVLVGVEVDTTGAVTKAMILAGPPMLQQASLDAAKESKFRPFEVNGTPVVVRTAIEFHFHLGRNKSD